MIDELLRRLLRALQVPAPGEAQDRLSRLDLQAAEAEVAELRDRVERLSEDVDNLRCLMEEWTVGKVY